MNTNNTPVPNLSEINLQTLVKIIVRYKLLFISSLVLCVSLMVLYIKWATPIYEVSTSLVIDATGESRTLGDSKYMDGGVGLIGTEKNIINEINILKSFNLVKQTLEDLPFDVSYYSHTWYKTYEHFQHFPIEVVALEGEPQLFSTPMYIEVLSDQQFRLTIEADELLVWDPETKTTREVIGEFNFSEVYFFNTQISHDYFNFFINKTPYPELPEKRGMFIEFNEPESLAQAYLDKINVNQVDIQASILSLSTRGPLVERQKLFLKQLVENYINNKLAERNEIASRKVRFIKDQLRMVTDSLTLAELNLEVFQKRSGAINLQATASNTLQQVSQLQSEQGQLRFRIKYYNSLLDYVNSVDESDRTVAPSLLDNEDPLLEDNLTELRRLYGLRNKMKGLNQINSSLEQDIRDVKNMIRENLKTLISSTELAVANNDQIIASQRSIIDQLPSDEKQLVVLQRKRLLYDNLYNYLSQELAKTGIAQSEDISDIKILDEARAVNGEPVSPQKYVLLILAVLTGLLIPLGFIVFFDKKESPIESRNDLERYSSIPVAASIAHQPSGSTLIDVSGDDWRVEESFRDLNATIQLLVPKKPLVIGVTSTIPDEGKTFVATNLAITMAKSGKRVLVLDADFRNPSIPVEAESVETKDLSDFLLYKENSISQIIQKHKEIQNLHFIPTFLDESNPHLILSSNKWKALLNEVKNRFDYIVVDSPALGLVSDYLLISNTIDLHLFVVRRKVTKPSFLSELNKLKDTGRLKNLFLIFNDALGKSFKYGYSDYEYGKTTPKSKASSVR